MKLTYLMMLTVEDILSEPNDNFEDKEVTDESNFSHENFLSDEINSISEDEEDDDDNNHDEKEENEEEKQEEDEEKEYLYICRFL